MSPLQRIPVPVQQILCHNPDILHMGPTVRDRDSAISRHFVHWQAKQIHTPGHGIKGFWLRIPINIIFKIKLASANQNIYRAFLTKLVFFLYFLFPIELPSTVWIGHTFWKTVSDTTG